MAADIGITLSFDGYKQFIGQLTAIQAGLLDVSDIIKISAKELDAYENELKKIQPDLDFDTLFGDLKNISTGLADFVKSFKGMDEINAEGAHTAIGTLIQLVNDLDQGLQERGDVNLLVDDLNKLGPAIRAFGDALGFFGRSTIIKNIGTNATQIVLALNSIAAGLKVKDFLDTLVPYEKALADLAVTIKGLIALGGKGALKGLIAVDLEQERQKTIDARKAHTELKEELREESDARKANKKAISEQEKELAKLSARQKELDTDYFTNEILESTRVLDRFIGSIFDTREAIDKLKPSLEIKIKVAGIKAFSSLISLITTGPIKLLGFMAKSFAQIAVAMGKIGFNVFIKGFKILLSLLSKGIQLVGKFALMLGKLAIAIVKIPVKILGNSLKAIMSVIKGVIHVVASLVLGLARLLVWSVKLVAKITLLTALFKVLMLPVKILTGAINALTGAVTRMTSTIRGSELDKTTQDMKELGAASTQTADAQNKLQVELSQTDKELQETQAGALKTQNALQGMNLVASGVNLAKTFATGRALTTTIKNVIGFTLAFKALQKATQAVSFAFQQVRFHLTNMVKEAFASAAAYEDLTLSLTALVTLEFKDSGLYTPDTTTDLEQKLKVGIDTQSFAETEKALQDLTKFDEEDLTLRFTTEGPEDNTNIIEYYLALNEADAAQERAAMSADGLREELKSLSQTTKDVVSSTANDFSASLQSLNQTAQQVANSGANTFSNMLNDLRELGNTAVSPKFDTKGAEAFANATDRVNERVQELLRWVRTLAIQSPFQEKDVAELLRYAQAMGFTSQQAQDLTQNVVDFGAAMKATPDQMKSVIRAFGQMRNASNLTKEDLNQLSEAGFRNPLQALADELEISVPEVLQAITDKAIDGEKAVAIFSRRMVADFAGSALKATKSLSGLASTMSSLRQNIMREFATPVFEVFKPLIAAFTGTDEINNMLKRANELGKAFAEKVEAAMIRLIKVAGTLKGIFDSIPEPVLNMIKGFAKFAAIATSVVIALTLLKTAVAATVITLGILVNPLSLAVGVLTAFGVTIVSVMKKVNTHLSVGTTAFGKFYENIKQDVDVIVGVFVDVFNRITSVIGSFTDNLFGYGSNIAISFANGIVAGVGAIANAITAMVGQIAYWLQPGSAPKALPNLAAWGQNVSQVFLDGMTDTQIDTLYAFMDDIESAFTGLEINPNKFGIKALSELSSAFAAISYYDNNEFFDIAEGTDIFYKKAAEAAGKYADSLDIIFRQYAELANMQSDLVGSQTALQELQEDGASGDAQAKLEDEIKATEQLIKSQQDRITFTRKVLEVTRDDETGAVTEKVSGLTGAVQNLGKVSNTALTSVGGIGERIRTTLHGVIDKFSEMAKKVSSGLISFAANVFKFGVNIGVQFGRGIASTIGHISKIIQSLVAPIIEWLSPGSPPKALPDIDQWGTDAANEFLGGFSDADFDLIEDYAGTLQDLVGAIGLDPGDLDFDDLALDFANLVASLNDVEVSDDAAIFEFYSELSRETGEAMVDIKNFADEYIHLAKEQAVLNSLTVDYEENLKKSNTQLDKLSREEAFADQSKELDNLNKALNNKYLTAEAKEKLELKRRRVLAELQKNEVDEQGAVVDAQQEQIDLMKKRLGLSGKFSDDPAAAGGGAAGAMAEKLGKLKVDDIAEEFADLTEGIDGTISTATNLSEALENMDIPELDIGKIFGDAQGQIQEKIKGLTARFEELGLSMTTVKRVAIALGVALFAPTVLKTVIALGTNLGIVAKVLARIGLVASIGLAPVVAIGAGLILFADKLTPEFFKSLGDSFKSFGDGLSSFFTSYQEGLGGAEGMSLSDTLTSMAEFDPAAFGTALGATLVSVRDTIVENIETYITGPFNKAFEQGDFYFDNRTLSERLRDGITAVFTGIAESVKETVSNFVINNIINPFLEGFSTDGLSYETFGQQIFNGLKAVFAPLGDKLKTFINETFDIDIDDITTPVIENFTGAFNDIDLAIDGASFGEKLVAGLKAAFASKEINITDLFTFKIPETSPFAEFFAAFGSIKDALPVEVLQLFSFWWERFRENIETTGLGAKLEVLAANFFTLAKYIGVVVGAIAGFVGIVAGSIFAELPALLGGVIDALSGIIGIVTSIIDIFIAVFTGGDVIKAFKDLFGSFKLFQTGIDGIATSIFNALANIVVSIFKLFNIPVTEEALKMIRKVSTVFGAVLGQILVGLLLWQGKILTVITKFLANFGRIGLFLTKVFGSIGKILGTTFGGITKTIGVAGAKISKAFLGVFANVGKSLATTFAKIGQSLITALYKIIKLIAPTAKSVGQSIVTGIFNALRGIGTRLASLLTKAFNKLASIDLTKNILTQFANLGARLKSSIDDAINSIVGKFKGSKSAVTDATESAFSQVVTRITKVFDDIISVVGTKITAIRTKLTDIFTTFVDNAVEKLSGFKTRISTIFDDVVATISTKVTAIRDAVATKFDDLATSVSTPFTTVKDKFLGVFDEISTAIGPKLDIVKEKVVTKLTELGTSFKTTLSDLIPKIGTVLDDAGLKIASAIDDAWLKISTVLDSAKFNITSIFDDALLKIATFIDDAGRAITNTLNDAGIKIKTTIKEALSGAFSGNTEGEATSGIFSGLVDSATTAKASLVLLFDAPIFETVFTNVTELISVFDNISLKDPFTIIHASVELMLLVPQTTFDLFNQILTFFTGYTLPNPFQVIQDAVGAIPAAIDALQDRLNLFSGFFDSLDFGGKFEGIGDTVNSFFSRGENPDTSGFTDGVAEGVVADLDASFSEADVQFDASNITVDEESFKAVGELGGENVKDGVLIGLEGEDVETDNVIANMGENIKGAWADFWDTSSPSEVAKEEMGKPIGEGILIGIKEALSGQDATEGLETDAGGGFLSSVLTVNPESITAFSTTFSTLFENVQQLLTDFIADFMDEMEDFLDDLIKFLDDEFKDIIQLVKDTFDTIIEKLNAFAIDVLLILNTLMANIKTVMDKFKTIMENAAKAGIQAFLDQLDGFGDDVKTKLEAELAFLNDDGEGSLREFMKEAGVELGDAVMKGIIAGIQTATPATVTAAANAVDSVVAAMQNAAGIASPSKVTMDNVGKPLIDGVKLGMFNATGGLLDQAGSSIKSAIDSAKVQISSASIDALRIPVTDDYMQSVMQQQSLPDSSKIATMQTASNKSVVNNTNYTMNMTVKESQATRVNRNFSKMKALRAV